MIFLQTVGSSILSTIYDVLPIVAIIAFFQLAVLRKPLTNLPRLMWGFAFVVLGLSLFLLGLQLALFPLGEEMAKQLTMGLHAEVVADNGGRVPTEHPWYAYYWTYLFAFAIGMSTTIAEPALMAVAIKAEEVSGKTIQARNLRFAVAVGAGLGVSMGTFRIVTDIPLPYFILTGYAIVVTQTYFAPRAIVPIAYDSGGVTTSTVTVPIIAALGLGLASRIPGRDPIVDGFGLIAFTALFPIISVMAYAQIAVAWQAALKRKSERQQRLEEAAVKE